MLWGTDPIKWEDDCTVSQDLNFPFMIFRVWGKILLVLSGYQFPSLHKEGHSQSFLEYTLFNSVLTLM